MIKPDYEALVIGTGFGGSVVACRLAQAGFAVVVLERGRNYRKDSGGASDFPRDRTRLDGWLWSHDRGLFDVKLVSEMQHVQAAGLGGGSLIYANVHLRVPADGFAQGWPPEYSRAALDPYYDLVAYMLDLRPITDSPNGLPPKTRRLRAAADGLGRSGQVFYPPLALNFGPPEVARPNKFGAQQQGCRHCGECVVGCRYQAKNTLDLNYLARAKDCGADVHTLCEAVSVTPAPGGGYRVVYRDHGGAGEGEVRARWVFVCAGSVNSTELLLRCRDQFRTLPGLSPALGTRYSGNGDYLAFAFNTAERAPPWDGPTITAGVLVDQPAEQAAGGDRVWFVLEDGGYPELGAGFVRALNPRLAWLQQLLPAGVLMRADLDRLIAEHARGWLAAASGAEDGNTAVFLNMGRDQAGGRLRLLPESHRLAVEWDLTPNLPLYNVEERVVADVAGALGGQPAANPFWRLLHLPVTVHNLGGCPMAATPADGVTDPFGEVHGYPGLYVLDGAILPASTGVNPSSTIAAVAERNVEQFIRRQKGAPAWEAPEAAAARAARPADPLAALSLPGGRTPPPRTPAVGLTFTETMRGFLMAGHQPADDYAGGERAARAAGAAAEFTVAIAVANLDAFLNERDRTAIANGRLTVAGLTAPEGAVVANGVFNLFVETGDPDARRMLYALPFYDARGEPHLLDGFKVVKGQGVLEVWPATTTLYTVIRQGHSREGPVVATGIIRLHWPDFARQLLTFRATGTTDPVEEGRALAQFGHLFVGTLWDVFATRGALGAARRAWWRFALWLRDTFGIRDRDA
jgi:cholesterol oxidase